MVHFMQITLLSHVTIMRDIFIILFSPRNLVEKLLDLLYLNGVHSTVERQKAYFLLINSKGAYDG